MGCRVGKAFEDVYGIGESEKEAILVFDCKMEESRGTSGRRCICCHGSSSKKLTKQYLTEVLCEVIMTYDTRAKL